MGNGQKYSFFKVYDLSNTSLGIIKVNPVISASGTVYRYSKDDISKIKNPQARHFRRAPLRNKKIRNIML